MENGKALIEIGSLSVQHLCNREIKATPRQGETHGKRQRKDGRMARGRGKTLGILGPSSRTELPGEEWPGSGRRKWKWRK